MKLDFSRIEPRLLDAARTIADLVRRAGGRALTVGGAVRDLVLGASVKDVDIEVFGLDAGTLRSVVGEKFFAGGQEREFSHGFHNWPPAK